MRGALVAIAAAASLVPALAHADVPRLTLDQLVAKAQVSERARMAAADRDAAAARVGEAKAARLPKGTLTGFFAPSPEIECLDPDCIRTDPSEFKLRFSGVLGGAQLSVTQPIYTFGKLQTAREAAKLGLAAQDALADATAADLAVDAARAYWGLKLARELRWMLEEGEEQITSAMERLDERIADGDTEVTIQDRQRVDVLLAEARAQLAEARQGEAQALAAVRALAGDPTVDIDEETFETVGLDLGNEAELVARAQNARPEVKAAQAGAAAFRRLADFEARQHYPDLAVVGSLLASGATGVDDPPSAFAYDPYNTVTGTLALALRWQLEPWTVAAKVDRARAVERRAVAQADLAVTGAAFEARTAYAEALGAQQKLEVAGKGEKAARAWLAAVLQADAIGAAEARDLADAYIAWFQMRARVVTAIFQWNVAAMRVRRAAGEFSAVPPRRRS